MIEDRRRRRVAGDKSGWEATILLFFVKGEEKICEMGISRCCKLQNQKRRFCPIGKKPINGKLCVCATNTGSSTSGYDDDGSGRPRSRLACTGGTGFPYWVGGVTVRGERIGRWLTASSYDLTLS